jgi:hypothetical protein|tara:strand:+ start:88 stop:369 length:282 start_codon:yes stop_codon:yes gene_type:complete
MQNDADNLAKLQSLTIETVIDRIEKGAVDKEGNYQPVSNDDLRLAAQLLKQNNITANLAEGDSAKLKAQMAKKLDFSTVRQKLEKNIASPSSS